MAKQQPSGEIRRSRLLLKINMKNGSLEADTKEKEKLGGDTQKF